MKPVLVVVAVLLASLGSVRLQPDPGRRLPDSAGPPKGGHYRNPLRVVQTLLGRVRLQPDSSRPRPPQRVVSTAPSITEMLFALGAGDRVVGVTTYCRYPEEAKKKPKIGDFASSNIEAILQQKPDLVVGLASRKTDLPDKLRPFRLPTLILEHESLEDIERSILALAIRLGLEARGRQLVTSIQQDLNTIGESIGKRPRRSVLFVVGRNPGSLSDITAVGPGSYLSQLVERSGGTGVFNDAVAYAKVSLEEILARDPEVIIDMSHGEGVKPDDLRAIVALWGRFPTLRAVRTRNVHVVTEDFFVVPGPRVAAAVRSLARMIHPEAVK